MRNLMKEYNPEVVCTNCGLVNDYRVVDRGNHKTAVCSGCDKYIKHLKQNDSMTLYFGKYKGRLLRSLVSKEELNWVEWALKFATILTPNQKAAFENHLKQCNQKA